MAVTSIWRVKGWLGKVVIYVENPEKTTNPEYYQSDAITDRQCQGLEDVISYAVNSNKTQRVTEDADIMERYVSGVNCNPSTAREEMLAVKKHFGKSKSIGRFVTTTNPCSWDCLCGSPFFLFWP